MKRKYNIIVIPNGEIPLEELNVEVGVKFCERELADMSDGKFQAVSSRLLFALYCYICYNVIS